MSKERRSGFELLRVLCIVGIIVMHTFPGAGEHASVFNREMNVLANSVFNTAVTCFVLISGYFGIQFRMKKLIELDLMVICFSVLSTVVMGNYGIRALVKACMPVITRQYWFISCYFALCILAPCLNLIAEKLTKEQFGKMLFVLLIIFSVIPTFTLRDIMMDAGKGLFDLVMIYFLGRYIALYAAKSYKCKPLIVGITLLLGLIFVLDSGLTLYKGVIYSTFSRDCSIFIIWASVLIVLLFREMKFVSPAVNRIASNVLPVYVLDEMLRFILSKWIKLDKFATEWYLILVIFFYALVVVALAMGINELRKATIGRLEPWISELINKVLQKMKTGFMILLQKAGKIFLIERQ